MKLHLKKEIDRLVREALQEDKAFLDITTQEILKKSKTKTVEAILLVKQAGVLAGLEVLKSVYSKLPGRTQIKLKKKDGDKVSEGQVIAHLKGPAGSILAGERVALNLLQHLSGIATTTANMVQLTRGTKAKILDTRKTLPGLRVLQKYAVKMGGGQNHRMSLADIFMIKENHIRLAGSLKEAFSTLKAKSKNKKLIVEVEGIGQLREALNLRAAWILLDNMSPSLMKRAVAITARRAKLEASGGITLQNVAQVAATGVDYISVGSLTHSPKALDISLLVRKF